MKSNLPLVSQALAETAQRALETHAAPITGLQLALLATPDGFEIACLRNRSELQTNRLSAMASSLMATASPRVRGAPNTPWGACTKRTKPNTIKVSTSCHCPNSAHIG